MAKASSTSTSSKTTSKSKNESASTTKKVTAETVKTEESQDVSADTTKAKTTKKKTTKATAKKTTKKTTQSKKSTAKKKSTTSKAEKTDDDVSLVDIHDDDHDLHDDSSLSDEDLLEGIPEEELKAPGEIAVPKVSSKSKTTRTRKHTADTSVTMLTGDPVRMYLKEIGKVSLLTAAEEIDLAMKIEAGVAATEELEKAEEEGTQLERRERRRLTRVEQVGLDAKQQLIEANLRLVVSIAKRYVGRGMLFLDLISGRQSWSYSCCRKVRLYQRL